MDWAELAWVLVIFSMVLSVGLTQALACVAVILLMHLLFDRQTKRFDRLDEEAMEEYRNSDEVLFELDVHLGADHGIDRPIEPDAKWTRRDEPLRTLEYMECHSCGEGFTLVDESGKQLRECAYCGSEPSEWNSASMASS